MRLTQQPLKSIRKIRENITLICTRWILQACILLAITIINKVVQNKFTAALWEVSQFTDVIAAAEIPALFLIEKESY